jgi:hypothetical protein
VRAALDLALMYVLAALLWLAFGDDPVDLHRRDDRD